MGKSGVPQPSAYTTLSVGELDISLFSVLETGGNQEGTIPSTHPLKVDGITFERPENVVGKYEHVKESEEADLFIALTHLGSDGHGDNLGDFQLAKEFPFFDLIIGGHSHEIIDTIVNGIPVFQAGAYLNYLGKIELIVKDKEISELSYELIDLDIYNKEDAALLAEIDTYNTTMSESLEEVIGYSENYHEKYLLGCFYTDALRERMEVDVTFQNPGGIRASLDEGDISMGEIYEIDPFNNGTRKYVRTVQEIKDLFIDSGMRLYYSGIEIKQIGDEIEIRSMDGKLLADTTHLSIGINDYIPATNAAFFPDDGEKMSYTTAEALIYYLKNIQSQVNYNSCSRAFRFER
jgi:2',3'-cyclic-nucleotide 2'-phosphodiesterase (5'-nucleotidase family)